MEPVPKRKRVSNSETVVMMLKSEAERAAVDNTMIGNLSKFLEQGDRKLKLMETLASTSKE